MSTPFYAFPSDNPSVPFASGQVTVGTSATLIGTFEGNQSGVLINNTGATVYLGGSTVTTTTGFPVLTLTSVTVPTNGGVNGELYGISASSTVVSFLHPANGGSTNL